MARTGVDALSQLDLDQSKEFEERYADRPVCPVAVVIAAYNEEANVAAVVSSLPGQVRGLATEVIVVVDGAKDNTAQAAEAAGALVCDVPVNRGQGAALRLGYHLARQRGAQFIVTTDADGQWGTEIEPVLAPVLDGEADFVSGSRRMGSSVKNDTARNVGVVVFATLISLLVRQKVTDPACGLRAMKAHVTGEVVLEQQQYQASELEIGVAMAGYRIREVPIFMSGRRSGTTKKPGNLLYGARFASVVVGTWARERRRSAKTTRS